MKCYTGLMIPTHKTCKHCESSKILSEFIIVAGKYLNSHCKDCQKALAKKWRTENPERCQELAWRGKGIDMDVVRYKQMHESQEGLCWVCRRPESSGRLLAVDHDHDTGEIRGLLCIKCNTALGWYEQFKINFDSYLRRE